MNDEELIVCVQDYANLYDQSHSKYHDNKMNSWQEIGLRLNQPADQCRSRWKSLRECYRKALRKRDTKSGQAAKKIKPWRLEQQMEFLKQFINAQREQESNVSEDESDLIAESIQEPDNSEAVEITPLESSASGEVFTGAGSSSTAASSASATTSTGDTANVNCRPKNKRSVHEGSGSTLKKPKAMTATAAVFLEYVNFKKQQNINKPLEMRQVDLLTKYFQGVEETVRTLPKEIQIRVKSKISQIVHDAELEAMYVSPNVYYSSQQSYSSPTVPSDLHRNAYIPQQQSALYHGQGDYRKSHEGRLDVDQVSPPSSHGSSNYSCLSSSAGSNYLMSTDDGTENL